MLNKKGQGLSTNAIILIILGIIVLVMLIVGFTAGWDKIAPWIKPSNNVKEIVDACNLACSTNSVYDYCSVNKTLILDKNLGTFKDGDSPTCKGLLDSKVQIGLNDCLICN